VLKALKKDKLERYASVEEMLDHLDSVDINETADKPTAQFDSQDYSMRPESRAALRAEKRITDRRSGDRRHFLLGEGDIPMLNWDRRFSALWAYIKFQSVPLFLIIVLLIILLNHLLTQPKPLP